MSEVVVLITFREPMGSLTVFGGVRVAHLFGFLCYIFFLGGFVSILCLLLNVSGLSILFSNVYSSNSLIKILNLNLQ